MANNVEKCIHILQSAKTDNEQFAGLLLVAKVIKAEECDEVTLQRLFDAIGFPFLTRLLRSSHVPEGCSSNVYRNLAVTVLSCFFQHPTLVMHPNVASCMPYFNDIITGKDSGAKSAKETEEADQLVSDCYDCLSCIAAQSGGRAMLIKEQCVSALSVAVHKQCPCWERAEAVLLHLVSESGSKTWQGNEHGLHVLLFSLTTRFKEDQGAKKFELCKTLGRVLTSMEKEQLKGEISAWTSGLYKGLTDIFKSKLGRDQRNPALMLASAAVDLLGVPWTMSVDGSMAAEGQNSQFLLLLVHLTCIEVRMTLEDRDLPQVSEIGDLLVSCYRLLENIIAYLATGPTLALDGRKVGQLHAAMVGAFNAVIFFLTRVAEQHPEKSQSPLVLASLRVLGSWIAEETTALQKEVRDLLPFIFSVCTKNLQQRRQVLTPDDGDEKLPEKMDVGDADDSGPPPGPPGGVAVPEVVRFLLPGLCHLSADDEARKVLLTCGGPELLISYFDYQWTFFVSPGNTEDCKMALTTLCGVMLNLVVLEGPLLAAGDSGKALLRCATSGLSFVDYHDDDLVLALNLAVLGLMMMRHYKSEEQAKCEPFCKSAIHLLSRAHCRKRTGPSGWAVHVSDSFSPHWADCVDLWHLGMQALAADLSVYPWLPRVVLGSGFVPIILRLLTDVKGDVEKDALLAYEGVLVAMVKNDKTTKQLLREQQAQQLARTHRMDELGRALAR